MKITFTIVFSFLIIFAVNDLLFGVKDRREIRLFVVDEVWSIQGVDNAKFNTSWQIFLNNRPEVHSINDVEDRIRISGFFGSYRMTYIDDSFRASYKIDKSLKEQRKWKIGDNLYIDGWD